VGFLAILIIIAAKLASCSGDAAKIAEAIQEAEQMHDGYVQRALIRIKLKLEAEQKTASEVFISYRHESEEHKDWVREASGRSAPERNQCASRSMGTPSR
jgi:hypothetical protein